MTLEEKTNLVRDYYSGFDRFWSPDQLGPLTRPLYYFLSHSWFWLRGLWREIVACALIFGLLGLLMGYLCSSRIGPAQQVSPCQPQRSAQQSNAEGIQGALARQTDFPALVSQQGLRRVPWVTRLPRGQVCVLHLA